MGTVLLARPAGPGERKSLFPIAVGDPPGDVSEADRAEQSGLSGHDQLQQFIASPAWDDAPLWQVVGHEADRPVGSTDAFLMIDDTSLPKKGTLSMGVARQHCGQLGKKANCQSLVSLCLAGDEVPV